MMPEKFSGDLLQYPYWNQSFETIVEQHTNVVSQRMFFLGKCTVGEAHTAIQGYLALNTEEAYHKVRAILCRRYGDKATQSTNHLCSLDSEEEITRSCRIVDKWLNREDEETQCYPPFEPFCDLLEQEARIACNTVYFKQNSTERERE